MFDVFFSLRSIIKIERISTDNNVFRLHYRFTTLILTCFSILVTLRQYIGDPIDCIQQDDIPENVIETYCWIHTTFTLPGAWDKKVGEQVPHPGIDKYTPGAERRFHSYYQWVCFVLFLQAIFFYIPRYMWKSWERKKMRTLVLGLDSPIMPLEERNKNKALLTSYLRSTMNTHKSYVTYYMFCELLNFVNVIGQIYLIDTFLNGEFTSYGLEVLRFTGMDQENRTDPMIKVFPRMTKCSFHKFGSSGDIQRHDALCILPLNIINEKIYIFLWFWFIILAVLSAMILLYRCFIVFWPATRYLALRSRARIVNKKDLHTVLAQSELGDWFVLYLLCKNMEPLNFRDVMRMLADELKDGEKLLDKRKYPFEEFKSV